MKRISGQGLFKDLKILKFTIKQFFALSFVLVPIIKISFKKNTSPFQFTCIFPDDKEFVRRMAYVETQDGQDADTYPDDYDGGIWKVSSHLILRQDFIQEKKF